GRTGTRHSRRWNALDPGFHGVPAGPIHPDRAADGAGVTGVRYGARAADRATSKPPARWCLWVPRCPCALWCASRSSARSALRSCRRTVPSAGSDRAIRGFWCPAAGGPPGAGLGSGEHEERSAPMTDRAIRASDKERESVVDVLRDAYTDGRLTLEEFEERTSTAYASKTWADLRELTADLPVEPVLG